MRSRPRAEELTDSYVDLTVAVGGPDPELGRRAAELFPYLVRVRAERPAAERRERRDLPTVRPTRISTPRSCARSPARNRPRTLSRSSTRCSRRQPMRPHELTLRGFRSYRDEVTFDFRGRHLVGIVGPIGAGKSSILDGIAFALFGKTPRVQKETKSLIHQLSDSAHVRLTFEVDGQTWQVTRALKRKGQGQVQLCTSGRGR